MQNCVQNLSVEAKVEATIQLEIDRLAAENLVRCDGFCHFKLNHLCNISHWFMMFSFFFICAYIELVCCVTMKMMATNVWFLNQTLLMLP